MPWKKDLLKKVLRLFPEKLTRINSQNSIMSPNKQMNSNYRLPIQKTTALTFRSSNPLCLFSSIKMKFLWFFIFKYRYNVRCNTALKKQLRNIYVKEKRLKMPKISECSLRSLKGWLISTSKASSIATWSTFYKIRPANLFLNQGNPIIGDFGLSTDKPLNLELSSVSTNERSMTKNLGTPMYSAPE